MYIITVSFIVTIVVLYKVLITSNKEKHLEFSSRDCFINIILKINI